MLLGPKVPPITTTVLDGINAVRRRSWKKAYSRVQASLQDLLLVCVGVGGKGRVWES
jgi:hypothetical protein